METETGSPFPGEIEVDFDDYWRRLQAEWQNQNNRLLSELAKAKAALDQALTRIQHLEAQVEALQPKSETGITHEH